MNTQQEGWSIDISSRGLTHYYKNGVSLCGKVKQKKHMRNFDQERIGSAHSKDCALCIKKQKEMNNDNNTQQTDRERAIEWFQTFGYIIRYDKTRKYYPGKEWQLLTKEEIEHIWRSETQSPTPVSKLEEKPELFTSGSWRADERDNPANSRIPFAIIKPLRGACVPIADICNFPPATEIQTTEQRANAQLIAASPDLYYALKEIVKDWVGEGNFRDIPVLKTQNDTSEGEFKYWTPAAKMVKSELIDKAIEVLKKANPDYNP